MTQHLKTLKCVSLDEFEPENVKFLVDPYLPLGKLTILDGDPGIGKSYFWMDLAARVTTGRAYPWETSLRAGRRVLVLAAEDGPADTIRPRVEALGGDASRIHLIVAERETGQASSIDLSTDADGIMEHVLDTLPALIVIDPLTVFMGGRTDLNRINEVQEILFELVRIAERCECAVLAIRHLNKGEGRNSLYRGIGSIGFVATARSTLVLAPHPSESGPCARRVLAHQKSNLAERGPSRAFRISDKVLHWDKEPIDLSPEQLLATQEPERAPTPIALAEEFLIDALQAGPLPADEIQQMAIQAGIAKRTLVRAKKKLGIESRKNGDKNRWDWVLPGKGATGDATTMASLATTGRNHAEESTDED